jgi:hypothetical protein
MVKPAPADRGWCARRQRKRPKGAIHAPSMRDSVAYLRPRVTRWRSGDGHTMRLDLRQTLWVARPKARFAPRTGLKFIHLPELHSKHLCKNQLSDSLPTLYPKLVRAQVY